MSVLWLRTAAALYSCGLLYALIYLFRKSTKLFTPALIAFAAGAVFHFVSIVELRAETGHLPLNNFYETSSLCAFLIAVLFLLAYTYYRIAIFGVCLFPLVFFMTLIGATEFPVATWSSTASAEYLADSAHLDGVDRLCGADPVGGGVGLLPVAGTAAEEQERDARPLTACRRSPLSTASSRNR